MYYYCIYIYIINKDKSKIFRILKIRFSRNNKYNNRILNIQLLLLLQYNYTYLLYMYMNRKKPRSSRKGSRLRLRVS